MGGFQEEGSDDHADATGELGQKRTGNPLGIVEVTVTSARVVLG